MVLRGKLRGRVGHCRDYLRKKPVALATGFFFVNSRLPSPRIVKTADYGPRWRYHFVRIASAADLDGELRAWLQEYRMRRSGQ